MAKTVTATEAKATILAMLDDAAAGEEVEITKHGRVVARLVPAIGPASLKGSLVGEAKTADAGDDLESTGAGLQLVPTGPTGARLMDESGVLVATGETTIDDDTVFGMIDSGRVD